MGMRTDNITVTLDRQSERSKVGIFRALQLGDLLCAIPAIRTLRASRPEAELILIGLPWARSFVDRFHRYLDTFIEFPGLPGFPEREPFVAAFPAFLQEVQDQKLDLALQMQGSGNLSNTLIALFGARMTAGFYLPGHFCQDPQNYLLYPEDEHEIWRHLRLMEFLGLPLQGDELEFPLTENDQLSFRELCQQFGLKPNQYICLHPGARAVERRWKAEKFAAVAEELTRLGMKVVLTGSGTETQLAEEVAGRVQAPVINLAGQTDLGALAALLSRARLLISNDTGVSHLAAALKVPSVVLFMASDPKRWAPLDRRLHRVIRDAAGVLPQVVLNEAVDLLSGNRVYARA